MRSRPQPRLKMEGIFLLVSLLLRKRGIFLLVFSNISCLSLLHEGVFCFGVVLLSLQGYQEYPWSSWGFFVVGLGKHFSVYSSQSFYFMQINYLDLWLLQVESKAINTVKQTRFSNVHLNPYKQGTGVAQTEQGSGEPPLKEGPIKVQSRDINEVHVTPDSLQRSQSELLPSTVGQQTESESKSLFLGKIIRYSRNTINTYSLLSHEWWVPP